MQQLLAKDGVGINSGDIGDRTPLLWAAESGQKAVLKLLLEKGAEPGSKDTIYGRTPLSWAAGNGYEAVVKLLLATGGIDMDSRSNSGRTPLS